MDQLPLLGYPSHTTLTTPHPSSLPVVVVNKQWHYREAGACTIICKYFHLRYFQWFALVANVSLNVECSVSWNYIIVMTFATLCEFNLN